MSYAKILADKLSELEDKIADRKKSIEASEIKIRVIKKEISKFKNQIRMIKEAQKINQELDSNHIEYGIGELNVMD